MSTFASSSAPGEGGGVCSYAFRPLLLGRSAKETDLAEVVVDDLDRNGEVGEGVEAVCERFTFFAGGGWASVEVEDFGGEGR